MLSFNVIKATLSPPDGEWDPGHNLKTKKKGQQIFTGKDLRGASNVVLHIPSFVEIETEPHCYRSGVPSFSTFAVASTFSTPHAKGRTENPDSRKIFSLLSTILPLLNRSSRGSSRG